MHARGKQLEAWVAAGSYEVNHTIWCCACVCVCIVSRQLSVVCLHIRKLMKAMKFSCVSYANSDMFALFWHYNTQLSNKYNSLCMYHLLMCIPKHRRTVAIASHIYFVNGNSSWKCVSVCLYARQQNDIWQPDRRCWTLETILDWNVRYSVLLTRTFFLFIFLQ